MPISPLAAASGGEVFQFALFLAILLLVALPLGLLFAVRWPGAAAAVARSRRRHRVLAPLTGVTMVLLILPLVEAARHDVLRVAVALAAMTLGGFAFVGLLAEARSTGIALRGRTAEEGDLEALSITAGWIVIATATLLPIVGAVVVGWLLVRGAGAAFLEAVRREPATPEPVSGD